MRVLVTGATGFIGSRLVEKLVDEGHDVICLARKTSNAGRVKGLADLGIKILYCDMTDENDLQKLPTDIDVVYHLAAIIDHTLGSYEPYRIVNVDGTRNLAGRFLKSGLKKFIFTSSIAAIGLTKTRAGLVDEGVRCDPRTFYGKSKYEAERLLFRHFNGAKFPILILRPPTVYGPGGTGGLLDMAKFVKLKIESRRPILHIGRGDTLTSLCYVDNLVDALVLAMKSKHVGEVFNIDDGRPYMNREILNTIANALGGKPAEIYVPKAVFYAIACASELLDSTLKINLKGLSREKLETLSTSMAFDVSKARKLLGYNPSYKFSELVGKTIAWYKKNNLL